MLKSLTIMTRLFKRAPWWGKLCVMIIGCLVGLGLYTGVVYAGYASEQRVIGKMDGYLMARSPVRTDGSWCATEEEMSFIDYWDEFVVSRWERWHERSSHAIVFTTDERIGCLTQFGQVKHVAIDAIKEVSRGELKRLEEMTHLETLVVGVKKMTDEELGMIERLSEQRKVILYIGEMTERQQKRMTASGEKINWVKSAEVFDMQMISYEDEMYGRTGCFRFHRYYPGPHGERYPELDYSMYK